MNYLLLPDFFAMSLLVGVLLRVRRRSREFEGLRLWIGGLMLILTECAARILYTLKHSTVLIHRASHVIALDAYLLAGILFLFSASATLRAVARREVFIWTNAMPMLVLLTVYGLDVKAAPAYWICVAGGVAVSAVSCLMWRGGLHFVMLLLFWAPITLFVWWGQYRTAVYVVLAMIYGMCAFAFQHRLPKWSRGSLAVISGFAMWSLCFLWHPWVPAAWSVFASNVWDMQKFVITVGLLVVMLEEQIAIQEFEALHDALTGLANRRMFDERLHALLDRAEREHHSLSVFTMDLNGFKPVNDTLGHEAGDLLLQAVAANLAVTAKPIGLMARQGGDEFSLIVPGTDEQEIVQIRRLLMDAVEEPINLGPRYDNQVVKVSASIGIATFPDDADEAGSLMRIADQRMYQQKAMRSPRKNRTSSEHTAWLQPA
jgi:diguanylate cyclase (GGDEF)-like protein